MLAYLLTASLLLFIFSFGYFVFLRAGPALPFRRRVLLLGIAGVLLLPLCPAPPTGIDVLGAYNPTDQVTAWQQQVALEQLPQPFDLTVENGETMEEAVYGLAAAQQPFWRDPVTVLLLIYGAGVLFLFGRTMLGFGRLWKLHRSSRTSGEADVRLLKREGEAFTFGRTIYLSESVYYAADAAVILAHERTHAGDWHTFDALIAEAMRAFFWFHPLAWWLREQVQLNLEYLADAAVLRAGYDKRDYQLSLVAHQQGTDMRTSLLPQFAAEGLKRRIHMMAFRAGSQVRGRLLCGGLIFACFATFMMTNGEVNPLTPEVNNQDALTQSNTNPKVLLDGERNEYKVYFRRLPTPAELEMIRQPLRGVYDLDLFVYHDCADTDGTFTFSLGASNGFLKGQVKLKVGERSTQHRHFELYKDGKGNSSSTTFRPQPLPEGAPDEDIFLQINGKFITINADDTRPFTKDNQAHAPISAQIKCQLGLSPDTKSDFNVGITNFMTGDGKMSPKAYIEGLLDGYSDAAGPIVVNTAFYFVNEQVDADEFYDQIEEPGQLVSIGKRVGDTGILVVARLDPTTTR